MREYRVSARTPDMREYRVSARPPDCALKDIKL